MFIDRLLEMSRPAKRAFFFGVDFTAILLALAFAGVLRYGSIIPSVAVSDSALLFPIMAVFGGVIISAFKLPQIKLMSFESSAIMRIAAAAVALSLTAMAVSYLFQISGPRSVPLIFGALFFVMATGARVIALYIISFFETYSGNCEAVAIYGAGGAGIQLAAALRQSNEARPVFFVDDNPNLQGLVVSGLHVYSPSKLMEKLERYDIKKVLLAMPSISQDRRTTLISKLKEDGVEVQVLPSYIDLMSGKGFDAQLKPVAPDQLLGRNKVDLDIPEIAKAYSGRVVMVTGAGGSIGSELCRQLVECRPARIVLFEQGEYALYAIDRELRQTAAEHKIPIVTKLGSVTNRARVAGVVRDEQVEIILHAAAYKHVPLVEENELEGARNNVLGTQIVSDVAEAAGVERFILVSTDKAVRPTNVMGATKRMAELVVQDRQTRATRTKFSMVRFGNVLGSSGSVLPLFLKQIEQGGPITVTHPDVTRFFMTIPEAARLVLLAGAYAEGGDVFVLDMGEPQKIMEIAKKLVELSRRRVVDPVTGEGDIEIKVTGLRPGEKLYEELLIDDESLRKTPHPKILRAEETMLSQIQIVAMLKELQASIEAASSERLRSLIKSTVDGYHQPEHDKLG